MTAEEKLKELGLTRLCEWNKGIGACDVGWGSADSSGVRGCCDGSARENCRRPVAILLKNLDDKAQKRLREMGDIDAN